jgi:murein hydrolase activator
MLVVHSKIFKILICISLLGYLSPTLCGVYGREMEKIGQVNIDGLNMRQGAGLDFPVVKVIKKDARFRILKRQDDWLQVIEDGDVGWVYGGKGYLTLKPVDRAPGGDATEAESIRAQVVEMERWIRDQQAAVADFSEKEEEIVAALHQTDLELYRTRRQTADLIVELEETEGEIARLETDMKTLSADIHKGRGYAGERLVALYKLNVLGEMNLLASAASFQDLIKQKAAIRKIIDRDCRVIGQLVSQAEALATLMTAHQMNKARQVSLEIDYRSAIDRLEAEKEKRRQILSDIRTRKKNRLVSLKYLRDASEQLDNTLAALSREPDFGDRTIKSFSGFKGLLKIPVTGRIASGYGRYTEPLSGATHFRKGIVIRAERGEPIRAVFSGHTVFAGWLRGYGNVIIIDHGENYHTVYAHAEDLFRATGESVTTGEVIATVGDSGALGGPAVYFEIRHHGNSVDPLHWIDNS